MKNILKCLLRCLYSSSIIYLNELFDRTKRNKRMEFLESLSSYYWYTDYYVLYDENNLTADKVEVLMYQTVILITYLNELFDRTKEWSLLESLLILIYHYVLRNKNNLTANKIEALTYWLCYLYKKKFSLCINTIIMFFIVRTT